MACNGTKAIVFDYWNPGSSRREVPNPFGEIVGQSPVAIIPSTPLQPTPNRPPTSATTQLRDLSLTAASVHDPWNPLTGQLSHGQSIAKPVDLWFETADLPPFDPRARRANWTTDSFLQPISRDARSKAKWVVAILQPSTVNERARWLRAFEGIFFERTDEQFFRKIRSIAAEVGDPEPLLGAIAIKDMWQDRHDFQRRRLQGGRLGTYLTDGGALSWPKALRIAVARRDHDPSDMIDSVWLDDWLRLRWSAEGYWSFAEYAVWRAEREQFEDWELVASLRHEDARWAAGQISPVDDVSGVAVNIRTGHASVPPAVAKRYSEWREKNGGLQLKSDVDDNELLGDQKSEQESCPESREEGMPTNTPDLLAVANKPSPYNEEGHDDLEGSANLTASIVTPLNHSALDAKTADPDAPMHAS